MSQRSRYLQGRGERSQQHGGVRRSGDGRLEGGRGSNCENDRSDSIGARKRACKNNDRAWWIIVKLVVDKRRQGRGP